MVDRFILQETKQTFPGKVPSKAILLTAMTNSGAIIATLQIGTMEGQYPTLYSMFVAKHARRNQMAETMVKRAIAIAREAKKKALRAWVYSANKPAIELYTKCGFFFCDGPATAGDHMMTHPLDQLGIK